MRSSGFSQQETPPDTTSGIFCQHPANGSARHLPLPKRPRLPIAAPPVAFRYPSSRACTTTVSIRLLSLPVRPTAARLPLRLPPSSSHTPHTCTTTISVRLLSLPERSTAARPPSPSAAFLFPPTHLQTGRSRSTTDYEPSAPVGRDNASIGCRTGRSHSHNKSEAPDLSVRSFET